MESVPCPGVSLAVAAVCAKTSVVAIRSFALTVIATIAAEAVFHTVTSSGAGTQTSPLHPFGTIHWHVMGRHS